MESYKPYLMASSSILFLIVSLISFTPKAGLWWLWPILFVLSLISTVSLFKNNIKESVD